MKLARVSYFDSDRIEHAVTVEARSLFHGVGIAISRFRAAGCDFGAETRFTVEPREPEVQHTVTYKQVEEWASRHRRSPAEIVQKAEILESLKKK